MIITKNVQTDETIIQMAKKAFPDKVVKSITELPEGMCNAAYCVVFADGSESILKIASKDRRGNTSNEICLMDAEVAAMKLVNTNTDIPIAEVYAFDCSRTVCDGDYFFMEKLKGDNLAKIRDSLSGDQIKKIHEEIGQLSHKLTAIQNPAFGMLGDERRFTSLYDFVRYLLGNLISDAQKRNINILYSEENLLTSLEKDQEAFEEVKTATLVHWDMWEGNIFVRENHVTGIIDWERAMWGEPFLDDRFRHHNRSEAFLRGFGIDGFSENEKKRIRWYDIILYLTMMIEVFYREFEDDSQYRWASMMLEEVYDC